MIVELWLSGARGLMEVLTVDVEVRESGTRLAVSIGDRVIVRLPEGGATGYEWSVEELDGPLDLVASELEFASEPAPGAAGERVVRLHVRGPGHGRLVMALRRRWETGAAPRDTFQIDVTVA